MSDLDRMRSDWDRLIEFLAKSAAVGRWKSRRLERANREIAERLDAAIGTIRSVLNAGEDS